MRSNKQNTRTMRQAIEKISPVVQKAKRLITLGLEGRQWLACALICAMLMPVFAAPISAANVWNGQNTTANNYSQFEPVNAPQPVWRRAGTELNLAMERWLAPAVEPRTAVGKKIGDEKKKAVPESAAANDKREAEENEDKKDKKNADKKEENTERFSTNEEPNVLAKGVKNIETQLPENIVIRVGQSLTLSALPLDKKGNVINGVEILWQSSNNEIIKIQNQQAFAVKEGFAKLIVKCGNSSKTLKITVVKKTQSPIASQLPAVLTERSEEEIRSLFNPQNNLGSPYGQVEAQADNEGVAMPRSFEKPGSSNFSFGVPIAQLPGRGIDAGIGFSYNSRIWNLYTNPLGRQWYKYNTDENWLAPGFNLSLGKLERLNYYNYGLTSPDGTRHQLSYISGDAYARTYESTDGTFMRLDMTYNGSGDTTSAVLKYSGGTIVNFSALNAFKLFPTKITDKNGNIIEIAYKQNDTSGRIWYIKDTLNRYINFHYDAGNKLVAVTVPGYNNGAERQAIRFYYETMNFDTSVQRFSDNNYTMPSSIQALKYVYFPGTNTGYKYEYSAGWGMIYKVSELRGMEVSANDLNVTGTVTGEGGIAASTIYNYPLTVGTPLNDVPKYTTRTDDWAGRTTAQPSVTSFNTIIESGYTKTSITSPNGTITETWAKIAPDSWDDGLVTDTFIKTLLSPQTYKIWSHTKTFWDDQTNAPGRKNPSVTKVEVTNDANQTRAITYNYDSYNNITEVREYDFAPPGQLGTELTRSEITYETGSGWISNRIFSLPKEVKRVVNGTTVKKTQFIYDNYGSGESEMTPRTDIIMYNQSYNPFSGSYNTATKYRGNVTKITAFSDATQSNDSNASVTTIKYDIAGNSVETAANCCDKVISGYNKSTEYAYQTSETRGSNGEELSTSVTYDFNTGLIKTSIDANSQVASFVYDPNSLRKTRVDLPDGGYETYEYEDDLINGPNGLKWSYVKSTRKIDATKEVSNWKYLDGRGAVARTLGTPVNGEHPGGVDIEYNAMGQVARKSNPYKVTSFSSSINPSNNWTTPTYDPLNRVVLVTLPDGNTTQDEFDGTTWTSTDQAGRKRRQIVNALSRVVRTDEPNANGNLGDVNSPNQPTLYEYDGNGNLTKVTQTDIGNSVTQERLLRYDSLSRLTHEKQVEETPKLDNNGIISSTSPVWTSVYKYNTSGLLTEGTNARGVKTSYTYDTLNRLKTVTYTGETGYQTPNLTYTYDEARSGYFNKGRLTKLETSQVGTETPSTTQIYDYDLMGRVKKETQTVGTNSYNLEYGYNLGGRLISQKYPSGRTVNLQIDSIGRPSTISDANRTYASNYQYATSHGAISSVDFGNGTTQSYGFNSQNLQLVSLSLVKGAQVIQKYEYGYGKIDLATGNLDTTKDTGQLARIDSYIGGTISAPIKQWQQRFDYDKLGRLREVREHRGDTNALSYKYIFDFDRFGNLYRKSSSNPATGQETALAYQWIEDADIAKTSNRFSSATGTQYDDEGNVTRDTFFRGLDYKYDANGRMVWSKLADNTGLDATCVYNGLGQRVATKVDGNWSIFVYDFSGKLVAEYGATPAGDEGGVKYYMQERQGSTSAVLSQSGFVQSRFNYQAFGEEIGAGIGMRTATQGFSPDLSHSNKYALNERDKATGLYHTWWRKLESQAGRWTSPDSFKGAASLGNPQSFNKYTYVLNDPANFVDPTGLYEACAHEAMTRFIGGLTDLKQDVIDQLALYSGGGHENAADGANYAATSPQNVAECLATHSGPSVTIHFANKAWLKSNARSYSTFMRQKNYMRAAHMLHSLQDGYGAHNGYSNTLCLGHGVPDGASGAVKGVGSISLGDIISKPASKIAGKIAKSAEEGAHATDRELGDADFINAANAVYQTMTGDSRKTLTEKQINDLIDAIVKACGGDTSRWIITRPGGGGGGGVSSSGGGIRGGSDGRQFDWLLIFHGWRDSRPTRLP